MSKWKTAMQWAAANMNIDMVQKLTCIVNYISVADRSCLVTPQNSSIGQIKAFLMAETDDGVLILPAKDSTVKVLYSRLNAATVIQYSQVDQVFIVAAGSAFKVYDSGIELNGSNYDGLVQIKPLVDKIQALEKDLNSLKNIFSEWIVAPNDGGGALFSLLTTYKTQLFNPLTKQSDLENITVKHGDGN